MIAAADTVVEANALRKRYGATLAVRDLTLRVGRGEVFGFIGPNGAGKTTSVKMLLGLVRPTSGAGRILGAALGNAEARRRMGFLPEHFRFHEWLTGRELLQFHGRLHGLSGRGLDERIDLLLARMELEEASRMRLREYSKGMLQRVGLAQALVGRPEIVFLDEPTSGLDPLGRRLVRDLIRDLSSEGVAVFLNSHLLSEVEITCHRVAFIRRGAIVHELRLGETERALDVELRIDRVAPDLAQQIARFGTDPRIAGDRIRLSVSDEELLPEMTRWLSSIGVGLYSLSACRRSLEDVFLDVMRDESAEEAGGK